MSTSFNNTDANARIEAVGHVGVVRNFVTTSISQAQQWAEQARLSASNTLNGLANFNPQLSLQGAAPTAPVFDGSFDATFDLPSVGPTDFGQINVNFDGAPTLNPVRDAPAVDITPYVPSIGGLVIPEAPTPIAFAVPDKPTLGDVVIPDAPAINKPLFPSLDTISIPDFDFPTLPAWDVDSPEFEGTAVSTVMQWSEGTYQTEVLDEVIVKLRDIWNGGNGLPAAIETALWERAANREDYDVARLLSEVDIDFSSRGFTQPSGVQAARADAIRTEAMIKKQGLSRDIAIRMAEIQIDNVKWAAEQGIASEQVLFNIYNNMMQRQFDAAKIQMDAQMALYNAQVSLFNAKQSAYATEAQIFKVKIDSELARIEVFKAQLEGELAKGQLNEQRVRIYAEQIRALLTDIEIYKAEMQGASLLADVNRNKIESFKAEVQAYAEQVRADKARFDAYDSQVKGELGKAQILDAEARAYASYVSGQSTVANIGIQTMQADISKNELLIRQYTAQLEAQKAELQGQVESINARSSAYIADTQRYSAQASAEEAKAKVQVAAKEAELRTNVAIYETEIRKYIADMEQLIRVAQIQLESLKAAGQVSSTMAAGAMAGINIGANLSGSGGVQASNQQSYGSSRSVSRQLSHNNNVNFDADNKSDTPGWGDYSGNW